VRRPLAWGGVAAAALIVLAVPVLSLHLEDPGLHELPGGVPVVRALADIQQAFPGGPEPAEVVVTGTAVIMVAVFSIFATLSLVDFKMFGVGMAAAVLIDATVVRGVLLPAGLALLGKRAWPRRASRGRYGATASVTCSEPPRLTNGWSRTRATAESMSSARSTE
jgi:uncharacterized membrane protein YdfJ with MMPL/SSD domain